MGTKPRPVATPLLLDRFPLPPDLALIESTHPGLSDEELNQVS